MNAVTVILAKEWLDLRKDRMIVLGTLAPALLLTALPLAGAWAAGRIGADAPGLTNTNVPQPALVGLRAPEFGQAIIGQQALVLFLLLPLLVPSIIASYSIVGEKTRRTLEPILATPVRSWELLLGKALAAFVPALALTWTLAAVYAAGMAALAVSPRVWHLVITPTWLIIIFLCGPLLALLAIALMVAISTRVNDPRTAQQLSGFLVMPLTAVVVGQLTGRLVLGPAFALGAAAVLALLTALAGLLALRLFEREVVLTRWR
jgi:ABC-2 type transport system permease protein